MAKSENKQTAITDVSVSLSIEENTMLLQALSTYNAKKSERMQQFELFNKLNSLNHG